MRMLFRTAFLAVLAIAAIANVTLLPANAADAPNVAIMKSLYDAFGKGDMQKIIDTMDDKVSWTSFGDASICSCLGPHDGKAGVTDFFKAVGDTWDFSEFAPTMFYADGDTVLVEGHYTMKSKKTGKQLSSNFAHAIVFKDGKVTSFREYLDTASMAKALAM
jgi:ketosteroid isomerase-like protein